MTLPVGLIDPNVSLSYRDSVKTKWKSSSVQKGVIEDLIQKHTAYLW